MPLPGGPAEKFGNRYETWWTINQLIRVIKGEAESIRIEDPSFPAAEFVLSIENRHEFHQAKRSHPRGKWSLSALENENLLQAIFRYLSQDSNARFVFVSGSDVPELRELIERANRAKNLEEFESRFLDTAVVYNILQCIEVRTTDERGIEDQVRQSLSLHFLSDHTEVCNALRAIVQDSMHATLDRDHLVCNLESRGFRLRRLVNPSNAPILVAEVTNRYTEDIRRQLINKSSITRSESETLLVTLTNSETSIDRVVTGNAGSGKSACILECVDGLRRRHSTVLAFLLDRIVAISSTKELGEGLGLEESPVLVLKAAAEVVSRDAVLIIDQLDAVSTASGRSTAFFDVVEDLLEEAQGCRDKVKFHIVLVCRKFDWENDSRLRRLLVDKDDEIPIADFSSEQVGTVLQTSGFKTDQFNTNQLKLLGLPQNLAVFLESNPDSNTRPRFTTNKELYDSYWEVKRRAVNERAGFPDNDPWHETTQELCDEMSASQKLSAKENLTREELNLSPAPEPFRPVQWLIEYHWHKDSATERPLFLTASICNDATDIALAADLGSRSDLYIVCALNKDVGTFDRMTEALHYHMYQGVVLVNSGEYGGSSFFMPFHKPYYREVFHLHGQQQASIAFTEVDPKKLIHRPNNEPLTDFPKKKKKKKKKKWKRPPAGWKNPGDLI